ncbi:tetratricopeptide repeat-containing sensor histidine kinase [Adhaeribacter radiodurans]|uniref:histidine kinase n=1 Tax=Adhaeribacter radiodurans TaxID=2745197 RepID=A0A7L7L8K0_9BACT|nr:ATP-binding protein [Adhaeribacter radiodurans]QMU29147.1 tetratricopeptide repeat-containing sensor histidine kinase [Adhaeribacter radiodurans]
MKKILLVILFLPFLLHAQNHSVDSLLTLIKANPSKTGMVDLNCQLSRAYQFSDIAKAKKHAQTAVNLASRFQFKSKKAEALTLLGYAHLVLGEYDQALACHFKSLNLAQQAQDTMVMVASFNAVATMYHKMEDQKRAVLYLQKAGSLALLAKDTLGLSRVYNNLGNVYEEEKKFTEAFSYFSKAARMQRHLGRNRNLAISLHNMGHVHINLPHPEKGLPYLFESLEINQTIQNNMLRSGTLGSIAQIYALTGKCDKAMQYAHESYDWAIKTKSSKKINQAAKLLQQFYADRQDYANAYRYLKIVNQQENILDLEHQKLKAAETTAEYERAVQVLQQKKFAAEKENQALKIRKQQVNLVFSAAMVVLLMVLLVVVYRSRQRFKFSSRQLTTANHRMQMQNKEIEKQRAELYSQAQILQNQNRMLENHNSFKSRIFTIISHDLRAPFNSLKGILTLIKIKEMSREDLNLLFNLLDKEMEQSVEMLQSLLIWSKSQLAGSNVTLKPVNIQQLVAENLQLVASKAEEKSIVLVNLISENSTISTDQERLNFVLRNIIHNAIKFTSAGGQVLVQTKEEAEKVCISVSDTGQGISPLNLSRLFQEDRFTTLGTSSEKGTGLGLMLCKELLESINASITVDSQLGIGSTFKILLPNSTLTQSFLVRTDELILN